MRYRLVREERLHLHRGAMRIGVGGGAGSTPSHAEHYHPLAAYRRHRDRSHHGDSAVSCHDQ